MEKKKFINPYNFIPLPQKKQSAYEDQDRHTGVIVYEITAKTPLFIPNTSNDNAFLCKVKDHKSYDFFSYQELERDVNHSNNPQEPVIPGSELRGMIRGIYETLTDSCMVVFNEELYPERRTRDVFQPGLIRRIKDSVTNEIHYELYKAKSYQYTNAFGSDEVKSYPEGTLLSFRSEKVTKLNSNNEEIEVDLAVNVKKGTKEDNRTKGYLIKGEAFGKEKKKHCHIFQLNQNGFLLSLDDAMIKRLKAVIESYQSKPKQEFYYKEYQKELDAFLGGNENEYFPVRYSLVEDYKDKKREKLLYLSPAAITKEIANTSLKDILGNLKKCEIYQKRCPACDLFGMIGNDHKEAIGSKVRFSDARVTEQFSSERYYDEIITRETLGGPKLSNPEFYLQKPTPNASAWNYDYYIQDQQIYLYSRAIPLRIRGRKYYVHQPNVQFPKNVRQTNLNATIRPLQSKITFQGKVFFEDVSQKQIDQLLWILNGGSEEERKGNERLWYKLGSGKPLGFGSVALKVISCQERKLSLENETLQYKIEPLSIVPKSYEENQFSKNAREDFIAINTPDYAENSDVTYPSVVRGTVIGTTVEKGFEWFKANKGNRIAKRKNSKIQTVLPSIRDKYLEQYELEAKKDTEENKGKNKKGRPKKNFGKNNGNCRKK